MNNYQSALDYLYSLGHEIAAMKFGTADLYPLLERLERPQQSIAAVHVAGTNGKGSFCASLASVLKVSGIRAGLFTSPHLHQIVERIQIDLQPISQEDFIRSLQRLRLIVEEGVSSGGSLRPSFFEHITLMALDYFRNQSVDLAVLEVGLGGRLDATNVIDPLLSVITPVDLDHCQYLGETVELIASEKAGIIKPSKPVLVYAQRPEAERVILERAASLEAPLLRPIRITTTPDQNGKLRVRAKGRLGTYDALLGLRGQHQAECAAAVITASEYLAEKGYALTVDSICQGLEQVHWPGRLELLEWHSKRVLLDGAHNPAGVAALCQYLDTYETQPYTLIFAAMRDKNIPEMARILFPRCNKVVLVRRNDFRSFEPEDYFKDYLIADGAAQALRLATECSNSLIVCSGSLHLIGELREILLGGSNGL